MIIILKPNIPQSSIDKFVADFESRNFKTHCSTGENVTLVGLIGDTSKLDIDLLRANPIVEDVKRVQEPFKKANRKFQEQDTVIDVGGVRIGGGHFAVMAGPCSVESEEQILSVAQSIQQSGAQFLRGGAFKPRTSPYAFQGLEAEGLKLLLKAKRELGIPIVTELMDLSDLELFADVDIIQIGARNMQNFKLLKEVGLSKKPILLKRGLANTIEEWLMSAEYIMAGGNPNVILCERGIRTFETYTRNTFDVSAIPVVKRLSHLPIIADPSHASGHAYLVPSLAKSAVAAGCDGLMIEVHPNPHQALSDGAQSLTPDDFSTLMDSLRKYILLEGKTM